MANYAPLPSGDPIATGSVVLPDGEKVRVSTDVTFAWERWFGSLGIDLAARPERVSIVDLSSQAASIAATAIPIGSITHGVYRVSYYARVTTAAGVSSSLTVELDWPDAVACTHTGAAMTGNTTTTYQEDVVTMDVDSSGPIRYGTTYASDAAGAMKYKLVITCEKVDV